MKIYKATAEALTTMPQFAPLRAAPGTGIARRMVAYFAGAPSAGKASPAAAAKAGGRPGEKA